MTYWNHRIIRKVEDGEESYGIHEAYYNDDDKVVMWTEAPVAVVADSREELQSVLAQMAEAFMGPVLDEKELPEKP